jgi:hypothetical protein
MAAGRDASSPPGGHFLWACALQCHRFHNGLRNDAPSAPSLTRGITINQLPQIGYNFSNHSEQYTVNFACIILIRLMHPSSLLTPDNSGESLVVSDAKTHPYTGHSIWLWSSMLLILMLFMLLVKSRRVYEESNNRTAQEQATTLFAQEKQILSQQHGY